MDKFHEARVSFALFTAQLSTKTMERLRTQRNRLLCYVSTLYDHLVEDAMVNKNLPKEAKQLITFVLTMVYGCELYTNYGIKTTPSEFTTLQALLVAFKDTPVAQIVQLLTEVESM